MFCGATAVKDGGAGLGNGDGERGDVMVLQRGSTADYDYVLVGAEPTMVTHAGQYARIWAARVRRSLP